MCQSPLKVNDINVTSCWACHSDFIQIHNLKSIYTERQSQRCDNASALQISLGLQPILDGLTYYIKKSVSN